MTRLKDAIDFTFTLLQGKPTTLAGYGITDAAPANAKYVTSQSNGTLSGEIVIPPMALNHNQPGWPAGFAGILEEYDSTTHGLTWSASNPATTDSNTTYAHHLYVNAIDSATRYGTRAWAPAGAFDARCHIALGGVGAWSAGLWVGDSTGSTGVLVAFSLVNTAGPSMAAYTVSGGSLTQRGGTWVVGVNAGFLRISRDGSNNVTHYWSQDGILWATIATTAFTFTPTRIGYRLSTASAATQMFISDWLRTDV